ncbi:hypothetical protein V1477_010356 [Vespula maculifrons]|uniref:Uncharacterized protein n=1 Tax=Vespula maculifrons TaxID=7453 RepID=A0ABD2C8Y7_VESMC
MNIVNRVFFTLKEKCNRDYFVRALPEFCIKKLHSPINLRECGKRYLARSNVQFRACVTDIFTSNEVQDSVVQEETKCNPRRKRLTSLPRVNYVRYPTIDGDCAYASRKILDGMRIRNNLRTKVKTRWYNTNVTLEEKAQARNFITFECYYIQRMSSQGDLPYDFIKGERHSWARSIEEKYQSCREFNLNRNYELCHEQERRTQDTRTADKYFFFGLISHN